MEHAYTGIVDAISAPVWCALPNYAVEFRNQSWFEYTGTAELAGGGKGAREAVHPDDLGQYEEKLQEIKAAQTSGEVEVRLRRFDGNYRWFSVRVVPVRDDQGGVVRWYATNIDIEDCKQAQALLKRAEAAMERTERFLNDTQRLTRTGSFLANFTTKEHFWSEETYRIFEYDRGLQPSPELVLARVHPEDRTKLKSNFERRHLREPLDIQYRLLLPDGRIKYIHVRGGPIENTTPGVTYVGAETDVTEARLAEEALRAPQRVSGGQVAALKRTLDTLAMEPDLDQLVGHILRTITQQFAADGASVWCRDQVSGGFGFELAYEDGRIVTKTDCKFAGLDLHLPTNDVWPWSEFFSTRRPTLIKDIREIRNTPAFLQRDQLLPREVVSLLLVPVSVRGRVEGAIGLRFRDQRELRPEDIEFAQTLADHAMLMIESTRLSAKNRQAAVIAERNRISRDMHDTLAQGFTGVIVQLEAAEDANLRGFPKEADKHLNRARELARESLNEARRLVSALRPQALDKMSFGDALQDLLTKMTTGTDLKTDFTIMGEPQPLPPKWEDNLFRIAQEILTNTLRHAQATSFNVTLAFASGEVRLDVCDDGRGFDPSLKGDGYGLLGVVERVKGMGGQFAVHSAIGQGTAILIVLPLQKLSETSASCQP